MLIKKESQREFAELVSMKANPSDDFNHDRYEPMVSPDGQMRWGMGIKKFLALRKEYDSISMAPIVQFEEMESTNKTFTEFKITSTYSRSEYDDIHYLFTRQEDIKSEEVIKSKSK